VDFVDRVAWAIEYVKQKYFPVTSKRAFAAALGTNDNTLRAYLYKKGIAKGEVLYNLVSEYEIDPNWLFLGYGEPFKGAHVQYPDVCGPSIPIPGSIKKSAVTVSEHVYISTIKPYRDPLSEEENKEYQTSCLDRKIELQNILLKMDWISNIMSVKYLRLFTMADDSMVPTLRPDDTLIVDVSRVDLVPGSIYMLTIDEQCLVRRYRFW